MKYTRTAGGATRAPELRMPAADVEAIDADVWADAVEEHELLSLDDKDHDQESFLAGVTTPVMFASALQNFGVAQLLDLLLDLAPAPSAIDGVDGTARQVDDDFSAFVFKVQSGMNAAHRDRLAYARIVSGDFERGMVVTHAATGRPFATKYAQAVFGREVTSIEHAYPGDIVGFVNAQALRVGDTVYAGEPIEFPPVPTLRPRALHDRDRRRTSAATSSSVAASSSSTRRASSRCCAPTCAATRARCSRPSARCSSRSSRSGWPTSSTRRSGSPTSTTRWPAAPTPRARSRCRGARGVEVLQRSDGTHLAIFTDQWRATATARDNPDVMLEPLPAGGAA